MTIFVRQRWPISVQCLSLWHADENENNNNNNRAKYEIRKTVNGGNYALRIETRATRARLSGLLFANSALC